jgi:hypothetical protein
MRLSLEGRKGGRSAIPIEERPIPWREDVSVRKRAQYDGREEER